MKRSRPVDLSDEFISAHTIASEVAERREAIRDEETPDAPTVIKPEDDGQSLAFIGVDAQYFAAVLLPDADKNSSGIRFASARPKGAQCAPLWIDVRVSCCESASRLIQPQPRKEEADTKRTRRQLRRMMMSTCGRRLLNVSFF